MPKPTIRIPRRLEVRALSVSLVVASVAACSPNGGGAGAPVEDASVADASDDGSQARMCLESIGGEGGTVSLTLVDGAPAGFEVHLPDGGAEVIDLDGGFGGTVVAGPGREMLVEMPGPCDILV